MIETPSSHRQVSEVLVTPLVGDVLFSERKVMQAQNIPAYGTAHPLPSKWPNHKFVYARERNEPGSQRTFDFFYAADRASQDLYNFSFTQADIGGAKFDAVTRTYVTPRATWSPTAVAMGAAMPNVPEDKFPGTYVLAQRRETRIGDQVLDSLYVAEELTYVKRCTLAVIQNDDATSTRLATFSNLYYGSEVVPGSGDKTAAVLFDDPDDAFWSSAAPIINEGRALSCEWYEITSQQVLPLRDPTAITGASGGVTGIPIRSYCTTNDYSWPGVLRVNPSSSTLDADNSITFSTVGRKHSSGNYSDVKPRVVLSVPPYRGPTRMTVEEWWVASEVPCNNLPVVETLRPDEVSYQGAQYNLRIEPTLHGAFSLVDTIGSNDPRFTSGTYGEAFPSTSPTDWPESLIADVSQSPFRGGYLVRVVTAHRPPSPIYRPASS